MDNASRSVDGIADHRYFCHSCDAEIGRVADDFTCPTCHLGFIEIVDVQQTPEEPGDEDMESANAHVNGILGGTGIGGRQRLNIHHHRCTTSCSHVMTLEPRSGPRPTFVMRNVSGRVASAEFVLQLLNQMRSDGLPPLSKEKIQEIPTALISQEHLDMKLQCSVCLEDFTIDEKVMKLTCDHMFHGDCIIPWLKLHGTCPICRKYLADNGLSSINSDPQEITMNFGANLGAILRAQINQGNLNEVMLGAWDQIPTTLPDWSTEFEIFIPFSTESLPSATQTPAAASGMSTNSSVTARNLHDPSSSADVDPMETGDDQNLPAVNNTNKS